MYVRTLCDALCELTALLQRIVRNVIMQEFLGVSSLGNLPGEPPLLVRAVLLDRKGCL